MSEYHWATIRADAIEAFDGETPGAEAESTIIEIFTNHPALVVAEIPRVAADKRDGRIRSGWAILKKRLTEAANPQANVVARDTRDRDKAIANADQWMRAAGMHYDRWDEVHDELFGDRGMLQPWKANERVVDRMRKAWNTVRPTGEAIELEAETRAAKWVADVKNAREQASQPAAQETPA